VANIIPSNYSEGEQETLKLYGFNWRCALWNKCLMTDAKGNPYCDSEGNKFLVPVVGYVVTNVKSPVAAPTGVEAHLSGDGFQVTVDWVPSPTGTDTLLGYYIYRSSDNQDPIQVNDTMLSATDTSFVDSSTLKSGKIYTYYVVACYENANTKYMTMNPKSSSVVWGIPQLSNKTKFAGTMLGNGSMFMITMASMGIAVISLGITITAKKKSASSNSKDEE
jgi:hypothetical protein